MYTGSFIDALNQESGAVVALATATSATATVVLIYWTIKYVKLTRGLVASSQAQFEHRIQEQQERVEADRHGLHELIKIFLTILNGLPNSQERASEMAHVVLWTEEDLIDMRRLSRSLGGKAISNVFWAIYHLNVIGERVRQSQAALNHQVKIFPEFSWEEYAAIVNQAKQELGHLLELL